MLEIIVFLLFLIPVLIAAFRRKLFKSTTLNAITKALNMALVIQLIIGVILIIAMAICDRIFYSKGNGTPSVEVFIAISYAYIIIGTFNYLPALGMLNLVNWIVKKLSAPK